MRSTTLLIGALAGFTIAAKLPDCAGSCISQAVKTTGCLSRHSQCICSHDSFESSVKACTVADCGEGKATGAAVFLADFCKSVNDLKNRHGGYQGSGKKPEHNKDDSNNWRQHGNSDAHDNSWHWKGKGKKVAVPNYSQPSAPSYVYAASMTVWSSSPAPTYSNKVVPPKYGKPSAPAYVAPLTVLDSPPTYSNKVIPPKYGKPSAPPALASMTVFDLPPAPTYSNKVIPPKYGKPSAPASVGSMTVLDSKPSPTIYNPGHYPAAVPSSNPWNSGYGQNYGRDNWQGNGGAHGGHAHR